MKTELKPCPFCGSEARLAYSTDNHRQPYVTCDTPKCPGCNTYQWHYHTEAEALDAWNHRAERTAKVRDWSEDEFGHYRCDKCGFVLMSDYVYCPNCGCKLDWSEEDA